MNKLILLFLFFLSFGASSNSCISGDCINGYGKYLWDSGHIYLGYFRDGKRHGGGEDNFPDQGGSHDRHNSRQKKKGFINDIHASDGL